MRRVRRVDVDDEQLPVGLAVVDQRERSKDSAAIPHRRRRVEAESLVRGQ